MLMTLKALSALLSYPTTELQDAIGEITKVMNDEQHLTPASMDAIAPLLNELATGDIYELQESYVSLFDRSRTLSLNLFEHVHGESRDRGGAMVDLLETYRAGGYELTSSELPDYLPGLLEFLASRPLGEAQETLADAAHILEAVRVRLARRESTYGAAFGALLQLCGHTVDSNAVAQLLAQEDDDPDDLEALDAVWEESQVTFGPDPNAGCPQVRDILSQMDTPVNPAPVPPAAAE